MLTHPIGGFFGLSLSSATYQPPLHQQALALNTGRSCFRTILQALKPALVHIPFYSCATLEDALSAEEIPFKYYFLDGSLLPELNGVLEENEFVLYINYFDLHYRNVEQLYARYGNRLIIDNVQAFFRGAYKDCWSFNSARKFYGLPDGAYVYGPSLPGHIHGHNTGYSIDHLLYRAMGENDKAYTLYKQHEHAINADVFLMSELSAAILKHTDHAAVVKQRRDNFAYLHAALKDINRFPGLDKIENDAVPFFYPLLPHSPVSRARLVEQRLFIPQFWPERSGTVNPGSMEDALVNELLPLPIDQRYGQQEMAEIVQTIQYEYQG